MRGRVGLVVVAVAIVVAACGGSAASPSPSPTPTPAPTQIASIAPATPAPTETPAPTPATSIYVVKKGDTLIRIAAAYKITLKALRAANPTVKDPTKLQIGQKLIIPGQ